MARVAGTLAACLVGLALLGGATAGQARAAPPALDYACTPAPTDCDGWYRSAVRLTWDWNDISASPSDGDCSERLFTADTAGTDVFCEVKNDSSPEWTGRTVTIRVDRTAPSLTGVTARLPDHGGWFNHPVGFEFRGQDPTSGVASCTSGTYGGPDGAGITVAGSCRDVAGNVGSSSFSLSYDATPPPAPRVNARPGNRRVRLRWAGAPEPVTAEVVRWRNGVAPKVVFSGAGRRYTDRGVRNGRIYRYAVAAIDRAGNRTVTRVTAGPTTSRLLGPPRGSRVRTPPLLVWKPVRGASYYNVQLYRGARKVLSRWPRAARLQLRERWRFGGRRALTPGRYRWYVWPGYGKRSALNYGRVLGKSSFTVSP